MMPERSTSDGFPWPPVSYKGKRTFDLAVGAVLLIATAPLLAVLALLVKLTSTGPVLYRGRRAGLLGREFEQLKLRTMTLGLTGGAFTSRADPRITPVGRFLRFFKLDEFPQLINVLRGEMSIVGPRPEDLDVVTEQYSKEDLRVLTVKPGLTCLLQVRIFPDFTYHVPPGEDPQQYYIRKILPERIREDLDYVDRMSLWLDCRILMETAWCITVRSWQILWTRLCGKNHDVQDGGVDNGR